MRLSFLLRRRRVFQVLRDADSTRTRSAPSVFSHERIAGFEGSRRFHVRAGATLSRVASAEWEKRGGSTASSDHGAAIPAKDRSTTPSGSNASTPPSICGDDEGRRMPVCLIGELTKLFQVRSTLL